VSRKHVKPAHPDRLPSAEWRVPSAEWRVPSDENRVPAVPADPAPVEGSLALRLADARTGFLRYAVAGAALIGAFVSTFAKGASGRSEIMGVMLEGTFAGSVVGIIIGWITFRIVERVAMAATPPPPVAGAVALGLVLPPCIAAGLVASIAGVFVPARYAADFGVLVPGVFELLVFAGLVLLPIGAVFGHRDRTRPATLSAALADESNIFTDPPVHSRTFWEFALGPTWFLLGFIPVIILIGIADGLDHAGLMRFQRDFALVEGPAITAL
jgi:hypothetical protein